MEEKKTVFLTCVGTEQEKKEGGPITDGVLLGVGSLYHVDHLLRLGNARRLVLFDPAWKEQRVLDEELEILHAVGEFTIVKNDKSITIVKINEQIIEFRKIVFDPESIAELQPDIVHGPHLRDTTTADGKRFDDTCRTRAVALAPEGCVFLNWETANKLP